MNLDDDYFDDGINLGPSTGLCIGYQDSDGPWSIVLGPTVVVIPTGKRRPPLLIPFKDVIVYLRGSLGLSLSSIEIVEVMASLGIPSLDDFLEIKGIIGIPISPEEIVKIKQSLNRILYGHLSEISMPIRVTEPLLDFIGKIHSVKKSKKKLKKIKEKLKSI